MFTGAENVGLSDLFCLMLTYYPRSFNVTFNIIPIVADIQG